jgi:tetratricopeptide (TPR) repeat protein
MQSFGEESLEPDGRLRPRRAVIAAACIVLGILMCSGVLAQATDPECGNPFVNTFGPHDYRVEQGQKRKIVEDYHFTPQVELLVSGHSASLGSDIDYTLRAFPNHHRALISMMNLGAKMKTAMPQGAQFSVECYFKRALKFRPDDTVARMIYAKYLISDGRKADAIRQVEFAAQGAQDDGFAQYNAGLIYLELGEFDKALQQAHKALGLGFERPGLKQQLQAAGKWVDPPPGEAAGAASSAGTVTSTSAPASAAAAVASTPSH